MTEILKISLNNLINNKKLIKSYLNYLIHVFYNYEKIICNNELVALLCFHPLPNKFITNNYINNNLIVEEPNNILVFKGTPTGNRIIFGNRNLPNKLLNPIPFAFPFKNNDDIIEVIHSNLFYYEIKILENYRTPWDNDALVVGYGSILVDYNTNPGWKQNTFGYHIDDGSFQYNNTIIQNFGPIGKEGDVIGAGIFFLENNVYKPFYTINGYLISNILPNIEINTTITPMLGFDYSHKIKYNFGIDKFKFNIVSLIFTNTIISNNNIFFSDKKNQNIYYNNNTQIIKNKLSNKINLFNFSNPNFINISNMVFSISPNQLNEPLSNSILNLLTNPTPNLLTNPPPGLLTNSPPGLLTNPTPGLLTTLTPNLLTELTELNNQISLTTQELTELNNELMQTNQDFDIITNFFLDFLN